MVVDEARAADDARIDALFHALADPTRRDLVRRAQQGEQSMSALARHYPISLPAVQKHLAVLERAGLITKERRGREQVVHTDLASLRQVHDLLDELEVCWRDRLDRFGAVLDEDHPSATTDPATPDHEEHHP